MVSARHALTAYVKTWPFHVLAMSELLYIVEHSSEGFDVVRYEVTGTRADI
jgi:hypothetical protein